MLLHESWMVPSIHGVIRADELFNQLVSHFLIFCFFLLQINFLFCFPFLWFTFVRTTSFSFRILFVCFSFIASTKRNFFGFFFFHPATFFFTFKFFYFHFYLQFFLLTFRLRFAFHVTTQPWRLSLIFHIDLALLREMLLPHLIFFPVPVVHLRLHQHPSQHALVHAGRSLHDYVNLHWKVYFYRILLLLKHAKCLLIKKY